MPSLADSTAQRYVKIVLMGDSGTGKTGALACLAKAGYHLHILDLDNKVANGILPRLLRDDPPALARIDFESLRDKLRGTANGPVVAGTPTAFTKAVGLMDKWSDGTVPATWGEEHIFVLDSLTFFSDAAFNWAQFMNQGSKDPRQWYGAAQTAVESAIGLLTSDNFATNLIINSHVSWIDRPDGTMKGYPAAVGKALGPTIPAYFDNLGLVQSAGSGESIKRQITFVPTALVDAKTPFKLSGAFPVETALATFFETARKR